MCANIAGEDNVIPSSMDSISSIAVPPAVETGHGGTSSTENVPTNEESERYFRLQNRNVTLFKAIRVNCDNNIVHYHTLNANEGRYLIKVSYPRSLMKWPQHDPDIHCIGSYITWREFCDRSEKEPDNA